jgi:hypothetical protein
MEVPVPLPQPLGHERAAERLDADLVTFVGEFLAVQCGTEVVVARPVSLEDLLAEIGLAAVVGGLTTQPVEGGIATGLELVLDALDLAGTEFEESGGIDLVRWPSRTGCITLRTSRSRWVISTRSRSSI